MQGRLTRKGHLLPLGGLVALSSAVQATPLITDSFLYTSGTALGGQVDTQVTPNQTWNLTGTANSGSLIGAGSLTSPTNLPASQGSLVQLSNTKAGVDRISLGTTFLATAATVQETLYYSTLLKVSSITNYTSPTGSFLSGFNNLTGASGTPASTSGAVLTIAAPTGAAANNATFVLGVGEQQAGTGVRVFDQANTYAATDTLFVVVAYTINPGASNDVAKLYVYKNPGNVDATEPAVANATSDAAAISGAVDIPDAGNGIQSFFVRNNSVEPTGIQLDELRVGTTWADVVPTPEPASLAVIGLAVAPLVARRRRAR